MARDLGGRTFRACRFTIFVFLYRLDTSKQELVDKELNINSNGLYLNKDSLIYVLDNHSWCVSERFRDVMTAVLCRYDRVFLGAT